MKPGVYSISLQLHFFAFLQGVAEIIFTEFAGQCISLFCSQRYEPPSQQNELFVLILKRFLLVSIENSKSNFTLRKLVKLMNFFYLIRHRAEILASRSD